MTTNITVTMTGEEAQYLLNSMDTHVKTHGLGVATMSVMILAKFQAASNAPVDTEADPGAETETGATAEPKLIGKRS